MRRIRRGWVMKETTRITPGQRGQIERIDLVEPSDDLGPSAAQGGQSRGRWRRLPARSWREGLCLRGVAAGLRVTPRHVGVRAVVVDEVAAGIGDVGEHAGHEVQCIDGLYGFLVVAAPWPARDGAWPWCEAQAVEADGVAPAVTGQSFRERGSRPRIRSPSCGPRSRSAATRAAAGCGPRRAGRRAEGGG